MPGIVGLVTKKPRREAESLLVRMLETMCHEDFYVTGTWVDETIGIYVGWVARKNSFSERMPIRNEKEDIVLIFSGEEFPAQDLHHRLEQQGAIVDGAGPSYLVQLYEQDPTFPACLNGRFHGLLVDRRQKAAMLFNDRYGMRRINYHESKEAFYFAAEAKAILAVCPELRKTDLQGLGEFIACGCVLQNRTLFDGIRILPPASLWTIRAGAVEKRAEYFQPHEWEEQPQLDPESYYWELKEVFSRNLPRYFGGSERIGISLTGGLDGRMILAWQKPAPGSLPCYTFGGTIREHQDLIVAREVARACQQSHEVIILGTEFLSRFSHYAERSVYLTDGCLSLSFSPDLYLNERARQIAPARMTGNYGSEVFRLHVAFKAGEFAVPIFNSEVHQSIRRARETYSQERQGNPLSFNVFKQAPWHHYPLLALEETQLSLRSPYLDNDIVKKVFQAPVSSLSGPDVCLRLIADGNGALRRIRTDRGIAGDSGRGFSAGLQHFHEFTFKAEYAYDMGMPQWLAQVDHILSFLCLERLFLGRHKFHYFRIWYRDELSQYVRDMLLDSRSLLRPYLERRQVEAIVTGHLSGKRNHTEEIHRLLSLELIHRLFLDR